MKIFRSFSVLSVSALLIFNCFVVANAQVTSTERLLFNAPAAFAELDKVKNQVVAKPGDLAKAKKNRDVAGRG